MIPWVISAVLAAVLIVVVAVLGFQRARTERLGAELRVRREQAEAATRRAASLAGQAASFIDQASQAMLLVDGNRRVTYFNPAAAALFEIRAGMTDGEPLIEVVGDHDLEAMVRRVLTGAAEETVEVRPPGSERILQATARPVFDDGQIRCAAVIVEDVSELHRLENMRRELVANVSHELRTPITAIKAMVETLQVDGTDSKLAGEFLGQINRELDGLAALVADLLELSRIEAGHLTLDIEDVPLREILDETLARFQVAGDAAGVSISRSGELDLDVTTDRRRASQVLSNLVDNAIKFSTKGGDVRVIVKVEEKEACLSVEDTGAGIAEGELARVFERFYKVDKARTRAASTGTGLGLAIAKHLSQALGGRIWAESREGAGSRFSFTLPLARPVPASSATSEQLVNAAP